jgi:hypothetical protein
MVLAMAIRIIASHITGTGTRAQWVVEQPVYARQCKSLL